MISGILLTSVGALLASAVGADLGVPSPAEQRIAEAREAVEKAPDAPRGYTDLALALSRRARETSDPPYYRQADEALDRALALSPGDFEAGKVRAWVRLGQHRFADALPLAEALNKRAPDDVMVYGILTDAYVELGRYDEAEKAAQWMLDLRPGHVPGITRAAYLRELFGDLEGARELMQMALEQTPRSESEDRAWILTQLGASPPDERRRRAGGRALDEALKAFPGYHYALGNLARVRTAQGRHADAVELLRERQAAADHPENLYELGEALERAGRKARGGAAFTRVRGGGPGGERRARQRQPRAHLLLCRPRPKAGGRAAARRGRSGKPPGRLHPGRPRLGALGERAEGRGARHPGDGARRRCARPRVAGARQGHRRPSRPGLSRSSASASSERLGGLECYRSTRSGTSSREQASL